MPIKTINITKKEFENSLIQLIQQSNIPACILVDIFLKYINQLEDIAESDYKRDIKNLEDFQKEQQEQQEQNEENETEENDLSE